MKVSKIPLLVIMDVVNIAGRFRDPSQCLARSQQLRDGYIGRAARYFLKSVLSSKFNLFSIYRCCGTGCQVALNGWWRW